MSELFKMLHHKMKSLSTLSLFLFLFSCTDIAGQVSDESNGAYNKARTKKILLNFDENKDGKFQKEEGEKMWARYKSLDENKDDVLTSEELDKSMIGYLTISGPKKLNVLYKNTQEQDLYLDIYYPNEVDKSKKLPVVVYTHGGGWAAGSRHGIANASFGKVAKKLLAEGFCVVTVSYRLYKKGGTTTMRDCVVDAKDALRYLSKNSEKLGIDSKRFFSFGDSAGGQIAQMLLLSASEELKGDGELATYSYNMIAGVSWYGPCDFEKTSLFNHNDRKDFRDRFGPRILKSDSDPKDKLALYREMSPINYLTTKSPPLLMIQGDKDTTIPVKHAYYMKEKADSINAPVEIMIIENAGHNWRKAEKEKDIKPTREEIIQKTVDFLVSYK